MNRLKQTLQNDLNLIDDKLFEGYNNNDLAMLNIDALLSIACNQNMRLYRSPSIKRFIRNYNDEECADKDYIDNYHKYKDFNLKITKIAPILEEIYGFKVIEPKFKEKISIDDSIIIASKFLKKYDKDIYDYFENFIINGKFFIVDNIFEGYGYSTFSDELLEPYIILSRKENIFYITTLIHEIIHVYLSEKEKYMTMDESKRQYVNGICEVYPVFIEFLVLDYLYKNNLFLKDINSYKKDIYSGLMEYLKALYVMIDPYDLDFNSYEEVKFFNESKEYSYGYLFAYHFYDQYKKNKTMAKDNITNFMLDSKNKEFRQLINNYGLNEDKLSDYKVLYKHVKKIY